MPVQQKEKLQTVIGLIDNISVDPDVTIEYFIPGVLVTVDAGSSESAGPYIQFTYSKGGSFPWVQRMPLKQNYLQKDPEDLVNFITFTLERFIEEVDSVENGAQ